MGQNVDLDQVQGVNHRRAMANALFEPRLVGEESVVGRQLEREIDGVSPLPADGSRAVAVGPE